MGLNKYTTVFVVENAEPFLNIYLWPILKYLCSQRKQMHLGLSATVQQEYEVLLRVKNIFLVFSWVLL